VLTPELEALRARVLASCLAMGLLPGEAEAVALAAVRRRQGVAAKGRTSRVPVAAKRREGNALIVEGYGTTLVDGDGALVIDHDDEILIPRLIVDAIHRAAATGPIALDVDHLENPIGVVLEHLVIDPARREALGIEPSPAVGWYIAARVDDPATVARVESGELAEFSLLFERARHVVDAASAKALTPGSAPGLAVLLPTELVNVSLVPLGAGRDVAVRARRRAAKGYDMDLEKIIAALAGMTPEALATLRAKINELAPVEMGEDGKGDKMPETPAEKEAKARADAASREAASLKSRLIKLELSLKTRDIAADLGALPGVGTDKVAEVIASAEAAGDAETAAVVRTLAKAAKSLAASVAPTGASGAGGSGSTAPRTYNDAVDLIVTEMPKASTEEIAKAIKSRWPRLRPRVEVVSVADASEED
jgi:hypothetical protein